MFKLLKLAFVVGALAAVWMLVPIGGRTLHARWTAAGGPEAFARATWAELDKALAKEPEPAPKAKGAREPAGARAPRPTEAHTERDRQAVDKILAEHLRN
jgi:hypothetical protein